MTPRPAQVFDRDSLPADFRDLEIVGTIHGSYTEGSRNPGQMVPLSAWELPDDIGEGFETADGRIFRPDQRAEYEALVAEVWPFKPADELALFEDLAVRILTSFPKLSSNKLALALEDLGKKLGIWPLQDEPDPQGRANRTLVRRIKKYRMPAK